MRGHVANTEEGKGTYRVLVGKPEAKRPLGRPTSRWEDNIQRIFEEQDGDDEDWIDMAD
jgi:hypothetical protein